MKTSARKSTAMRIQNHPTRHGLRLSPIVSSLAFVALGLMPHQNLAQSTYEPYTFTTLAGGAGFKSPDTPGGAARFNILNGIAVDNAGNLYVADVFNHAIR